jgi:hypothetical protein
LNILSAGSSALQFGSAQQGSSAAESSKQSGPSSIINLRFTAAGLDDSQPAQRGPLRVRQAARCSQSAPLSASTAVKRRRASSRAAHAGTPPPARTAQRMMSMHAAARGRRH